MKPQIDFIFSGKTFDKAIVERVLEWRIFIKQQQDILLPIYHKVSFSRSRINDSTFLQINKGLENSISGYLIVLTHPIDGRQGVLHLVFSHRDILADKIRQLLDFGSLLSERHFHAKINKLDITVTGDSQTVLNHPATKKGNLFNISNKHLHVL